MPLDFSRFWSLHSATRDQLGALPVYNSTRKLHGESRRVCQGLQVSLRDSKGLVGGPTCTIRLANLALADSGRSRSNSRQHDRIGFVRLGGVVVNAPPHEVNRRLPVAQIQYSRSVQLAFRHSVTRALWCVRYTQLPLGVVSAAAPTRVFGYND